MRVLVLFECSRATASAFEALGHEAWSCDIKPSEVASDRHLQMDVWEALRMGHWDLVIMHPPCTYLSVSGIHWNNRGRGWEKTGEALTLVKSLMYHCEREGIPYCPENPVSIISTHIRKPDQIIQPYYFGDDASKKTCLWLHNLPQLEIPPREQWFPPRITGGKERWSNQTDSGQNRLGPSEQRATNRARTYPGIARAFAETWSKP